MPSLASLASAKGVKPSVSTEDSFLLLTLKDLAFHCKLSPIYSILNKAKLAVLKPCARILSFRIALGLDWCPIVEMKP
jgi:hypothetical protein